MALFADFLAELDRATIETKDIVDNAPAAYQFNGSHTVGTATNVLTVGRFGSFVLPVGFIAGPTGCHVWPVAALAYKHTGNDSARAMLAEYAPGLSPREAAALLCVDVADKVPGLLAYSVTD